MWQEIIVVAILIASGAFLVHRYRKKLLVAKADPTDCADVCDACSDKPLCKREAPAQEADEKTTRHPTV
ncbi:MAG: hypothetical protein FJ118_05815 [Deltaproteobacteria bacterium]|nr:hypothetical protein [Deltaproteobacteria bacterium]